MSVIPSLSPFAGASGIGKSKEALSSSKNDLRLSELNKDYARMVDTFVYDYPKLVRDNKSPFAQVTEEGKDVRVAIIGSGFAGATVAYELHRAGIKNITIYEAREKCGGRAYSRKFIDKEKREYVNELGPMRIPGNSKLFWHYLSEILGGIDDPIQKIFPNPGVVATQIIFRGLKYTWKDEDFPQPVNPDDPNNADWKQLHKDIREFIGSLKFGSGSTVDTIGKLLQKDNLTNDDKNKIKEYWKYFLLKYNDLPFIKTLEDYFVDRWGAEQYNMFSTLGLGTGGFGPLFPVCFLEIFRILLWQYANEYTPSLSMNEIVTNLLDKSEVEICQKETVDYIGIDKNNSKKVNVHSIKPSDNDIVTRQYDYVIVATTIRSMQIRINLDAEVPPRNYSGESKAVFSSNDDYKIRESLRGPHIMNSSKLFGFLPTKPWTEAEGGIENWPHHKGEPIKCVLTDTLARQMYFLDPYPNEKDAGSNVLISYNWGDDSIKIMAIRNYQPWQVVDQNATPDIVLKNAYQFGLEGSDLDSPIAASLKSITTQEQLASVVWQEEPMIFGAFKIDYPNQFYATSRLVYQYQQALGDESSSKRVYLAGNNCSFQGGWVEGAMQSAVNASAAVLKHMESSGLVENFRMGELFEPNPFQDILEQLEGSTWDDYTSDLP